MTLTEAIDAYITLERSLGAVFSADTRILRSFARALGDIDVHDIGAKATREYLSRQRRPDAVVGAQGRDTARVLRIARQPQARSGLSTSSAPATRTAFFPGPTSTPGD